MHSVLASDNNYADRKHPNFDVFSFLLQTNTTRRPQISKNYKQNNALFCSPFHQHYTVQTNARYLGAPATLDSLCHDYTLLNIEPAEVSFVSVILQTTLIAAHVHPRIIVDYYPHLIVL